MACTLTDIMLKNAGDIRKARDGLILEKDIRQAAVTAMVDTGFRECPAANIRQSAG